MPKELRSRGTETHGWTGRLGCSDCMRLFRVQRVARAVRGAHGLLLEPAARRALEREVEPLVADELRAEHRADEQGPHARRVPAHESVRFGNLQNALGAWSA